MCGGIAAVCIAVATDLPAMADLLPIVVREAFQEAPSKDVALYLAGTQFPVGVDLRVVDHAGLLLLSFLSAAALHVVGQISVLAFVEDPRYQGWEWLEEVVNKDGAKEDVKVH